MAPNRGAADPLEAFKRAGTVLAVCAHPDDESCGLGAVLALAVSLGKHVSLLTCTHGEAGITPTWRGSREELAATREGELGRAAEILGVHRRIILEYQDGLLAETDPEALDRECLQIMHRWHPDVVLAYDPLGVTCHPDHVAVGESVLRVWSRTPNPPALLFWTIPDHGRRRDAGRPCGVLRGTTGHRADPGGCRPVSRTSTLGGRCARQPVLRPLAPVHAAAGALRGVRLPDLYAALEEQPTR